LAVTHNKLFYSVIHYALEVEIYISLLGLFVNSLSFEISASELMEYFEISVILTGVPKE